MPYHTADARASASIVVTGEMRSAPANGGTTARTPGMKRLSTSDSAPYLPCSSRRRRSFFSSASEGKRLCIHTVPCRRPTKYIAPAPATFPTHVAKNAQNALPCPRAANQLPRATTVSAGTGGNTFSTAANNAMSRYSAASGTWVSQSSRPAVMLLAEQRRRGDAGESLAAPDEAHALVGLPLDAHVFRSTAHRSGDPRAHRGAVRRDLGRLGDDHDIDVPDSPARGLDVADGEEPCMT